MKQEVRKLSLFNVEYYLALGKKAKALKALDRVIEEDDMPLFRSDVEYQEDRLVVNEADILKAIKGTPKSLNMEEIEKCKTRLIKKLFLKGSRRMI